MICRKLRRYEGRERQLSRRGSRSQSVARWIKGFKEGMPYDEHAALRYPEITEPCLYSKRTYTAQVLICHPGRAGLYHPGVLGFEDEPLAVGHLACQRQMSCPQHKAGCFSHRFE